MRRAGRCDARGGWLELLWAAPPEGAPVRKRGFAAHRRDGAGTGVSAGVGGRGGGRLDCFGEALLLLAAAQRRGRLDEEHGQGRGDRCAGPLRPVASRDAGIWEWSDQVWTHSRFIRVAGLRAVAAAAPRHPLAETCTSPADTLLDAAERTCLHADGHGRHTPDDTSVDAALLLPAYAMPCPPPIRATGAILAACRRQLAVVRPQPRRPRDRTPRRHCLVSAARQPPAGLRPHTAAGGGRPAR